jgi:glutamate/tyrosine decarboxylase-like PLP-dependent enzyme
LAFGKEGYQRLLSQFVAVNNAFRKQVSEEIPDLVIANPNNPGIITLLRLYQDRTPRFREELSGACSYEEIHLNNKLNEHFFELLGKDRDRMFFGDTKKHLFVTSSDGNLVPLYASKLFVISPYTQVEDVPEIVRYLKDKVKEVYNEHNSQLSNRRTVEFV